MGGHVINFGAGGGGGISNDTLPAKVVACLAGLDPTPYNSFADIAASSTAMAAVAASSTAMTAVAASQTAMAAVAASSTAMAAVIASQTALNAVVSSQTAMAAVIASPSALNAVVSSQTAMTAICNSSTARSAVVASSTARTALKKSPLAVEKSSGWNSSWNNSGQSVGLRGLLLYTSAGNTDNALTILKVDSTVLTTDIQTRNAATKGDAGYKDWIEAYPNNSWVLATLTIAVCYPSTTKIKYIPCN